MSDCQAEKKGGMQRQGATLLFAARVPGYLQKMKTAYSFPEAAGMLQGRGGISMREGRRGGRQAVCACQESRISRSTPSRLAAWQVTRRIRSRIVRPESRLSTDTERADPQEHAFFRNAQGGKKKRVAHDISAGNGRHGKGHSSLTGQASDVPKMSLAVSGLLRLCSSRIMIWMITRR